MSNDHLWMVITDDDLLYFATEAAALGAFHRLMMTGTHVTFLTPFTS